MPLGWIGNVLIILGAWQLGHKRRWAFLITFTGGLFWVSEGIRLAKPDLIFIEVVMGCVAIRNFIRWGKNEH